MTSGGGVFHTGGIQSILDKNLLIEASAGSGKTYQLGNRVIGLITHGAAPERIVALTFTRKAAAEFADAVLIKLANAASDPHSATRLAGELALDPLSAHTRFQEGLRQVIQALPRLHFGTIDGFFTRVVRGFQMEFGLTGGRFELLQGPRADAATDALLGEILGEFTSQETADTFFRQFRRSMAGRESPGVLEDLRKHIRSWLTAFHEGLPNWGPPHLAGGHSASQWEQEKSTLAAQALAGIDAVDFTHAKQRAALEKTIDELARHQTGDGSLGTVSSLTQSLFEACAAGGPLHLKSYREFTLTGPTAAALQRMCRLAADAEMDLAASRTQALHAVLLHYDALHETRLRRNGLLGFADVKRLMGRWRTGEDHRLRREAVDFRLDTRHEHWLLDEFQDTSRDDWNGLQPLLDEAASPDETNRSLFLVGDRKQAIYGWRGGEVGLFREVREHYLPYGLQIGTMAVSWRSCPDVLKLVNRICRDQATLLELFGPAAAGPWECEEHLSARPAIRGESKVEIIDGGREMRLERLAEILTAHEVGQREMTCGVLVRSNDLVGEVAEFLRSRGFDVIEEGARKPSRDNPVGVTLGQLIHWLANPRDGFALGTLRLTPLAGDLHSRFGPSWQAVWEGLHKRVSELGYAGLLREILTLPSLAQLGTFGRRRAGDLISALAELDRLDRLGRCSAAEAADWLDRLEVAQNPGVAAVQVMTIHKSKGLGFDLVVLPEISTDPIPQTQRFDRAQGRDWVCQTPPAWARKLLPPMVEAENTWAAAQRYEAFCLLYVALTRAKTGLHVLLDPPSDSAKPDRATFDNWILRSLASDGLTNPAWQAGDPDWFLDRNPLPPPATTSTSPAPPPTSLGPAIPHRRKARPSGLHDPENAPPAVAKAIRSQGARFGSAVHLAFEAIGWIDEQAPPPAHDEASRLVHRILQNPGLRPIFERRGRTIELLREQPVEAILHDAWLSGLIDRLHLHRNDQGQVTLAEIIDFKTDALPDAASLVERHRSQMQAYQEALQRIYPAAKVACFLLSTHLSELVPMP